MPLIPGHNLSANPPPNGAMTEDGEPEVIIIEEGGGGDTPTFDDKGNVIRIEHEDGSVTISLDGRSLDPEASRKNRKWFDNLVEDIDEDELSRISQELLRGIEDDIRSRQEWIEERAQGIKLLGLKIEIPGLQGATDGAPVEGMSKIRHPILQEAVLRFQANARAELLPTDGPVKIRNDNNNATLQEDQVANALEMDANHYLTSVATEYYPDTDRMLLMLGFGGTAFKKIYFCPLRNRPVSETVDADDLIVNNSATDLRNAKRITHRSYMRPSLVKRLQILGVYRDIDLHSPVVVKQDAVQEAKKAQQGISPNPSMNPEDNDYEIYETYCELEIKGFEHEWKGKDTGLEIPYRVTLDKSSTKILSIVRNYDKPEEGLPEAKVHFAKYTFVPGFGFYDIGLLHILGNTANALTAAWRELLDAGMFACFPGFLMADLGARQQSNVIRIPPGGGHKIQTNGMPISQVIMPLPYKEPSQALMALAEEMSQTGMRVGGTSEQQVGEGRADAPVGTTLAMIDQATKVLNSVHKRMHASQAEEFRLFFQCFREHPESFWQRNKKPAYPWDQQTFLRALDDYDLTPQADPNTSSHGQRVMKIQALKILQQMNPSLYDPIAVDTAALQAIGWSNPQQFLAPPSAMQQPPPELQEAQAMMAAKAQEAQAKTTIAGAKAKEADAKSAHLMAQIPYMGQDGGKGLKPGKSPHEESVDAMKAQADLMNAHTRAKDVDISRADTLLNDANQQEDRQSQLKLETMRIAKEAMIHNSTQQQEIRTKAMDQQHDMAKHQSGLGIDMMKHQSGLEADAEKHETGLGADMEKHSADTKLKEKALKAKPPKPKKTI